VGTRCRQLSACLILLTLALAWLGVLLLAHEYVAASIVLTNAAFGVALLIMYVGLWLLCIVLSRSPRFMLIRAIAATLSIMFIMLMLELSAAFRLVHWEVVIRSLSGDGADYMTAYALDKDLSFRRIPNLHWSERPASDIERSYGLPPSLLTPISFTYDPWGYRNATAVEHADVVLLGDSYVEGWYVSDEQTVASRLASRLARPVANLGVAGYGTIQEFRVLERDALTRCPQVIAWFFFEGNDLYDDQEFENFLIAEPPSPEQVVPRAEGLTSSHGWRKRSFLLNSFSLLRHWSHHIIPNRVPYWAFLRHEANRRIYFADYGAVLWTEYEESRWDVAKAYFKKGIELARAGGVHVILLYIPIKYRVYRELIEVPHGSPLQHWNVWPLPTKFMEFCKSVQVPCIDLTDRLQQAARQGIHVYAPTDTHWSAAGHELVAAELEGTLCSLGWVSNNLTEPH
jgi:SGNH hydrolase-like domain, acetyltransferase AlgX